jgi:hypothetical protein
LIIPSDPVKKSGESGQDPPLSARKVAPLPPSRKGKFSNKYLIILSKFPLRIGGTDLEWNTGKGFFQGVWKRPSTGQPGKGETI